MKSQLVLLLIAAVGSTALVASAQTPPPSYTITGVNPSQPPPTAPPPPAVPMPPGSPSFPGRVNFARPGNFPFYPVTVQEVGVSREAEQLAQRYTAEKSDAEREKIKNQLTELLKEQFDQRQKRHEEEIKQLEAQVKKLRDLVDKRQENRREIITRRLDQILREAQGLGW